MEITTKKLDDANVLIVATIQKSEINSRIDKLAKEAGTQIKVDGFRKGKVPAHIVKKLHGEKLEQDAEGDVLKEVLDLGTKELGLEANAILGQPTFKKFDKTDAGIDVEIELSTRPEFVVEGYKELAPSFEMPVVEEAETTERLESLIKAQAPLEKISQERAVADADTVLMDFEGSIDGVPFEGGSAEAFSLAIGSNQFIPGFEEQLIGVNPNEETTITVTFPQEYHSKDLAGKESQFKVTVKEIQEKTIPELNDELAGKMLQGEENPTVDLLKEKVTEQIKSEKVSKIYNDELKPKMVEALVNHFSFSLPNNIVEQEIEAKVNAKAQDMSPEELDGYRQNPETVETLREELRGDAENSVKATFIVDAVARKEEIVVSDDEVSQALYYEAMMSGQNPQEVMKHYQDNNLLPAVKMGMIEDKLFSKILGL